MELTFFGVESAWSLCSTVPSGPSLFRSGRKTTAPRPPDSMRAQMQRILVSFGGPWQPSRIPVRGEKKIRKGRRGGMSEVKNPKNPACQQPTTSFTFTVSSTTQYIIIDRVFEVSKDWTEVCPAYDRWLTRDRPCCTVCLCSVEDAMSISRVVRHVDDGFILN